MSRLATCPRCQAFVQPGWSECKICGYGPDGAADARPPRQRKERVRPRVLELLGGLATLVVLALIAWGAVAGIRSVWDARDDAERHQEYVAVPN
jgi:hypothetical protein